MDLIINKLINFLFCQLIFIFIIYYLYILKILNKIYICRFSQSKYLSFNQKYLYIINLSYYNINFSILKFRKPKK